MLRTLVSTAIVLLAITFAHAAPQLGERTRGNVDISFQPFAGGNRLERTSANDILRLEKADKKWMLVFDRNEFPNEIPLKDTRAGEIVNAGYLTVAVEALKQSDPTSEVLRSEVMDLGKIRIGMIIATIQGPDNTRQLLQRAMVEVTSRLYYTISMTSPAPEKKLDADAGVKEAAEVFRAMIDTVQQVDLSKLRQDQDERLYRTRGLFVAWNAKKLNSVLENEQYFRIRKAGKDVGYFQVKEGTSKLPPVVVSRDLGKGDPLNSKRDPKSKIQVDSDDLAGVDIKMSTQMKLDDTHTAKTESTMFTTSDREHEIWTNVVTTINSAAKTDAEKAIRYSEVGSSDRMQERKYDTSLPPDEFKEAQKKGEVPYDLVETYTLRLSADTNSVAVPKVEKQLPPFYIPQALNWMLPRLLPIEKPNGYLFAIYSPDNRQIMLQYVDVELPRDITLAGKKYSAVPISIRIGDEGSTTVHYMTRDGKYLGSYNATANIEISASDLDTIKSIWKDAGESSKNGEK